MAQTLELQITGMSCDHCVRSITTALEGVSGVTSARVTLSDRRAVVEGDDLDAGQLAAAVEEEGYEAAVAIA